MKSPSTFSPRDLSAQDFDRKIAELEAELAWWRQGRQLFFQAERDAASPPTVTEIVPPAGVFHPHGPKPILRQAILRVMGDEGQTSTHWRSLDIISALGRRGWMPTGKNAENTVRQRIRDLAAQGLLHQVSRGTFMLAPPALEQLGLHPSGRAEP